MDAIIEANVFASEMVIEPVFHEKCIIHRKKQFNKNFSEEAPQKYLLELIISLM